MYKRQQLKYDYEFSDEFAINSTLYRKNISWYTHYGLLDRYFLDLALVESGSNRLAPGSKWALSPTVSAAWVLPKTPSFFCWIGTIIT